MSKLFLGFLFTVCFQLVGSAQDDKYTEIGAGVGGAVYQGDLSPYAIGTVKQPGLNFQLFGNVYLSPAFSLRLNYAFAFLQESDKHYSYGYKPYRNFSFDAKVNEFSTRLLYNPFKDNGYEDFPRLEPYLFAGAGIALLNITRDYKDFAYGWREWQKWVLPGLAADSAHQLPKYAITLPVGAGLRYFYAENVSLFAEITQRFTNQEYLDGFSQAANKKKKDAFATITVGIIFRRPSGYGGRVRYY